MPWRDGATLASRSHSRSAKRLDGAAHEATAAEDGSAGEYLAKKKQKQKRRRQRARGRGRGNADGFIPPPPATANDVASCSFVSGQRLWGSGGSAISGDAYTGMRMGLEATSASSLRPPVHASFVGAGGAPSGSHPPMLHQDTQQQWHHQRPHSVAAEHGRVLDPHAAGSSLIRRTHTPVLSSSSLQHQPYHLHPAHQMAGMAGAAGDSASDAASDSGVASDSTTHSAADSVGSAREGYDRPCSRRARVKGIWAVGANGAGGTHSGDAAAVEARPRSRRAFSRNGARGGVVTPAATAAVAAAAGGGRARAGAAAAADASSSAAVWVPPLPPSPGRDSTSETLDGLEPLDWDEVNYGPRPRLQHHHSSKSRDHGTLTRAALLRQKPPPPQSHGAQGQQQDQRPIVRQLVPSAKPLHMERSSPSSLFTQEGNRRLSRLRSPLNANPRTTPAPDQLPALGTPGDRALRFHI